MAQRIVAACAVAGFEMQVASAATSHIALRSFSGCRRS